MVLLDANEDLNPPVEVQAAPQGRSVVMRCQTELSGPVSYEWSKQDEQLPNYVDAHSVRLPHFSII